MSDPKYVPIVAWAEMTGMTRTAIYHALVRGDLRAIKQPGGRRTLIDVEHGLAWLRSQPSAVFGTRQHHPDATVSDAA